MRYTIPLLTLFLLTTSAAAGDGVYGSWRPLDGRCRPANGQVEVGRFGLAQDEWMCVFQEPLPSAGGTVSSACGGPDGGDVLVQITATLNGDRLTILRDATADNADYIRCEDGDL